MPSFYTILETNDLHPLRDATVRNYVENTVLDMLRYYTETFVKPYKVELRIENTTSMSSYATTYYNDSKHVYVMSFPKLQYDKATDTLKYNRAVFDTLYDYIGFMIGIVEHEIGHISYTYPSSNEFFESEYIEKIVWGILEDGRIESKIKHDTPSMSIFIDHMNNHIFGDMKIHSYSILSILSAINYRVVMHKDPYIFNNETESLYNEIMSVIPDRIYTAETPDDLYDVVTDIVNILKEYFNDDEIDNFSIRNSPSPLYNIIERIMYNDIRIHLEHNNGRSNADILIPDSDTESPNQSTDANDISPLYDDSIEMTNDDAQDIINDTKKSVMKSPHVMIDKIVVYTIPMILSKISKTPNEIINSISPMKDIMSNAKELNSTLSRSFRYIEDRYKFNYYSARGRILSKKLYRIVEERINNKPPQIFLKRRSNTKIDVTITILMDMSSSMDKNVDVIRKVGMTLLYALSDFRGIKIGIYGFSSIEKSRGLKIIEFKPYLSPISRIHHGLIYNIGKYDILSPSNTTPMHGALDFVYKLSTKLIPDSNHMYFVITDGLPSEKNKTKSIIEKYRYPTYAIYYDNTISHEITEGLNHLFRDNVALATTYQAVMDIINNDIHDFILKTYAKEVNR